MGLLSINLVVEVSLNFCLKQGLDVVMERVKV